MLTSHSRQHILLAVFLSLQAFGLGMLLHNGLYALFFHVVCKYLYGNVCAGDEPVFFIISLFVVPTGFVLIMVPRLWRWAVADYVAKMGDVGIEIPGRPRDFAPFINYRWLWRYSLGLKAITGGRMRPSLAFAAVLLLGGVGFFAVRCYIERWLYTGEDSSS